MRMTDSGSEDAADPAGPVRHIAAASEHRGLAVPAVPFGEWPSPIAAAEVASGQMPGVFPTILGSDTWWQQGLPDEGGRTTVMHDSRRQADGAAAAPWNARTRVHEYGGLSYLPVPRSALAPGIRQGRGATRFCSPTSPTSGST